MEKISTLIEIDGAQGEGGGQVLRTALSLSACRGLPVHIRHIRQGREKPGLMRQHLACVKALAEVCGGEVRGAFIGSKAIEFIPGPIRAGTYDFSIGSAGSTTLVFQTVLPALLLADKPSHLTLTGGTHNPMAPSVDFIEQSFLPVLRKMGCEFELKLNRYGFYPVGAGQWTISIYPPETFRPLAIENRGQLLEATGHCVSAGIPGHVVVREKAQLLKKLQWPNAAIALEQVESLGAGNYLRLNLRYEGITETFDSIGKVGVSAERVATEAIEAMRRYQSYGAPVGHYLADQLLLPMCLGAGGAFVTEPLSLHCQTNVEVIRQMTGLDLRINEVEEKRQWRILLEPSS